MLLTMLQKAMEEEVNQVVGCERSVALAFSGGVDSSLLAKICGVLNKSVTLLTVGFTSSHDMAFSGSIASMLKLPHKKYEIEQNEFSKKLKIVIGKINCRTPSHVENCIAYLFIAYLAKKNGFKTVLTANGLDELFCGYNQYRLAYNQGRSGILDLMKSKITNELLLMEDITLVTSDYGISVKKPFLSERFIKFAKTIPLDQKIKGEDDRIRKHIIRRLAIEIGVPMESAMKPKKALQYGSLIHKYFIKSSR
jgi:asparagine synthase (glutamine-hydrolysing)